MVTDLINRVQFKSLKISKAIYQTFAFKKPPNKKTIIFVVGCQRSGTSLMMNIFDRDYKTKVYRENTEVFSNNLRLKSFNVVKEIIDKDKAPLVILKPLLDTQRSKKMLEYFDNSKILWIFRHYKDVASSNIKRFGIQNGINDLKPIVQNDTQNWRAENVSKYTREVILKYFSEDMNPYDAAALFWFARNRLFFELQLDTNPNVIMCKYEDLVTNPVSVISDIYRFIGTDFPGKRITTEVHCKSKGEGKGLELSLEIESLCHELWESLNEIYNRRIINNSISDN